MIGSMKLFLFYKEIIQTIGILSAQLNRNHFSINLNDLTYPIFIAQFFVTSVGFFLFDAKSLLEYGMSFYDIVASILAMAFLLINVWQMRNIFKFIENCERFIEESKYCLLFSQQLQRTFSILFDFCTRRAQNDNIRESK